jgi:hypothetical protein
MQVCGSSREPVGGSEKLGEWRVLGWGGARYAWVVCFMAAELPRMCK